MGINLGAFIAPLFYFCGDYFTRRRYVGIKYGFLTACIGMIIGQIVFNLLAPRYLGTIGTTVVGKKSKEQNAKVIEKKPLTTQEKKRTLGNFNFNLFRCILLGRI